MRCCVRIDSKAQPSYEQAKPPSGTRRNQRAGERKKRQQRQLRRQQREAGLIPPATSSPSNSKSRFQSTEEESAARTEAVSGLLAIMRRMLPILLGRLGKIPDPREPQKLKHQLTVLMIGSSDKSVGRKLARAVVLAYGLMDNIPVTHRVHRPMLWICGQRPC